MEKYGNRHPAFSRVDDGHWSACGAFGHSVHNTRIRLSSPLCKPFIFRMGLPSANPYNISIWNSWNSSVLFPFFPTSARLPARQSIIMLYTWLIYIKWNGTLLNRMGVWGSEECLPETDFCYWPSDGHNISLSLDASSSRLLCFAVAGKSTLHHPSSQSVSLTFDPSSMVTYYVSISWATQGE